MGSDNQVIAPPAPRLMTITPLAHGYHVLLRRNERLTVTLYCHGADDYAQIRSPVDRDISQCS